MDRLEERAAPAAAALPQRKDQAALSATERGRFLAAVNLLNQRGFYGALVSIHSDMSHTMHNMGPGDPTSALGQQRFLPWHRVYLSQLEQQLQNFDPDVTIPYWDWTKTQEQNIPHWLQGMTLTVTVTMPDPGMGLVDSAAHADCSRAVDRDATAHAGIESRAGAGTKVDQMGIGVVGGPIETNPAGQSKRVGAVGRGVGHGGHESEESNSLATPPPVSPTAIRALSSARTGEAVRPGLW
jgi:hypothetical protein